VNILYLKICANADSKGFEVEILTLTTNLAVNDFTTWQTRTWKIYSLKMQPNRLSSWRNSLPL